ncbi:MAG: hypothetical protein LBF25_02210 [Puniceicoccales bacterium]|jgi:predicted acylesterase/phospholipase RssA|nr:hypothetical protein [Puniceicoccales bacterium]
MQSIGKHYTLTLKILPNMPIAYAGRISMSLPTIFKSLYLDLTRFGGRYAQLIEGLSGRAKLFDGGLASNVPTEFFVNGEEGSIKKQFQQHNTLTCIFNENGSGHRASSKMHGFQQGKDTFGGVLKDIAIELVSMASGANTNIAQNNAVESGKLDDTGNIMVLGHGPLETLSFDASPEEI